MRGEYSVRFRHFAIQILQIEACSNGVRNSFANEFTWLEIGQRLDGT